MIDLATIPDPGLPLADDYYLQHARARLHALGIRTPEAFVARYGVDIRELTAFELLWIVDQSHAEREIHLNVSCRAGLRTNRTAGSAMTEGSRAQPAMNVRSEKGGNSGISTEAGGGIPLLPQPLSIAEGVTLNHPRTRDRSTWTPVQRETYCDGCIVALTAIKVRLERGVLIHTEYPSVAAEVRWLRLATRAIGLIGKQAYASADAGTTFCASPLGKWYDDLEWLEPSDGALSEEW